VFQRNVDLQVSNELFGSKKGWGTGGGTTGVRF
jgi:hypothetical protein